MDWKFRVIYREFSVFSGLFWIPLFFIFGISLNYSVVSWKTRLKYGQIQIKFQKKFVECVGHVDFFSSRNFFPRDYGSSDFFFGDFSEFFYRGRFSSGLPYQALISGKFFPGAFVRGTFFRRLFFKYQETFSGTFSGHFFPGNFFLGNFFPKIFIGDLFSEEFYSRATFSRTFVLGSFLKCFLLNYARRLFPATFPGDLFPGDFILGVFFSADFFQRTFFPRNFFFRSFVPQNFFLKSFFWRLVFQDFWGIFFG